MKFHTRHEAMELLGRRISKGEWERMNRAYAVYPQHKLQIVGYEKTPAGSNDTTKPLVRQCLTLVILPETPRHHRKVSRRDRWGVNTKRDRYREGKEVGIVK